MKKDIRTKIKNMPKVDLHVHLDGALRPQTILDLAREQGYKLPADNVEELKKFVQVSPECKSLVEFLATFEVFYPLLRNGPALERIAYEFCEDMARDNVRYCEVRFAPVLQQTPEFSMEDVVVSVLRGLERGQKDFPVTVKVILCCYRLDGVPIEASLTTVDLAKKYSGAGVVGIDLAGDEYHYPATLFREAFARAREYGMKITVHAGEAAPAQSIRDALDVLGAHRIGHGVRLKEDRELWDRIIAEKIPLEMCLTSNVQTQVVSSLEAHPAKHYFDSGVQITLNTDDPGVSDTTLTQELCRAHEYLGFTLEELEKIMRTGMEHAFVQDKIKEKLLKEF